MTLLNYANDGATEGAFADYYEQVTEAGSSKDERFVNQLKVLNQIVARQVCQQAGRCGFDDSPMRDPVVFKKKPVAIPGTSVLDWQKTYSKENLIQQRVSTQDLVADYTYNDVMNYLVSIQQTGDAPTTSPLKDGISWDEMSHPVTLPCGHSFNHSSVFGDAAISDRICPLDRKKFELKDVRDNNALKKFRQIQFKLQPKMLTQSHDREAVKKIPEYFSNKNQLTQKGKLFGENLRKNALMRTFQLARLDVLDQVLDKVFNVDFNRCDRLKRYFLGSQHKDLLNRQLHCEAVGQQGISELQLMVWVVDDYPIYAMDIALNEPISITIGTNNIKVGGMIGTKDVTNNTHSEYPLYQCSDAIYLASDKPGMPIRLIKTIDQIGKPIPQDIKQSVDHVFKKLSQQHYANQILERANLYSILFLNQLR